MENSKCHFVRRGFKHKLVTLTLAPSLMDERASSSSENEPLRVRVVVVGSNEAVKSSGFTPPSKSRSLVNTIHYIQLMMYSLAKVGFRLAKISPPGREATTELLRARELAKLFRIVPFLLIDNVMKLALFKSSTSSSISPVSDSPLLDFRKSDEEDNESELVWNFLTSNECGEEMGVLSRERALVMELMEFDVKASEPVDRLSGGVEGVMTICGTRRLTLGELSGDSVALSGSSLTVEV